MKPDLYTKAVLTVIAFMLVMIGCHQYVSPTTTVKAEGPFAEVQYNDFSFFDPRTGELWMYSGNGTTGGHPAKLVQKYRLVQLGQPLLHEFEAK